MAELTEQQKLEIHNKLYQAGKGMIPVQELTYAASQLCKDNSEANQVEVLRDLKQFSMPGVGTSSAVETIAAEAVRDACDREQPIEEITEEMGVNEWWAEEVRKRRPKNYCPIEGELEVGNTVIFGKYMQAAGSLESGQKDPLEWIVLKKDVVNGKALLLSTKVLSVKIWGSNLPYLESGMYSWLYNEFLPNAFDDTELDFIMDTDLDGLGQNNPSVINDEKVFLLSNSEYTTLIGDAEPLCFGFVTEYCKELAASENININYTNGHTAWWLRTSGQDKNWGSQVGTMKTTSTNTYLGTNAAKFQKFGVRPAVWVKL